MRLIQSMTLVAVGLTVVISNADTIYVPDDYPTIQAGINAAEDGDEVVVCDGTYTGPGNKNLDFHGKAITVRSASGNPDLCIIDCEGDGRGFYFHSGETAVVDGFTITNGYTSDDGAGIYCEGGQATITNCTITANSASGQYGNGGGVSCRDASLTITDCTISSNEAGSKGGGVYCEDDAQATITNCAISSNAAGFAGGGVYCEDAQATITNCTISSNEALAGGGFGCFGGQATITNCTISGNVGEFGGGVDCYYIMMGPATISNCTITGNFAVFTAGGVYCTFPETTVTNCTISGNTAGHEGGGVSCGSSTITNCTITDNWASGQYAVGGGVYCDSGSPTIRNCTIADNAANGGHGGGIRFTWAAGSPVVTNCLITGNTTAGSGGGLCCDEAFFLHPTLTDCTFAHNTAAEYGGAVYGYAIADLSLGMTDCILWADLAPWGAEIALMDSAVLTTLFSDVQGGEAGVYISGGQLIWGEGNIDADPLFVAGPLGDYYLSQTAAGQPADSPCVNAGSDTAENLGLDTRTTRTDQVPDGGIVDMGYHYPIVPPGDLNGDGCVDQADLGILLADWNCTGGDCPGDCDHDGDTDQGDLGILLAHWGEGCP